MRDKKYLRSMKKRVNWIENQEENLCKILKNLYNTTPLKEQPIR